LTKLGTYLVLKKIWNPIDFQGQGHRVKFLGEGIRHALRCPCYIRNIYVQCVYIVCLFVQRFIDFKSNIFGSFHVLIVQLCICMQNNIELVVKFNSVIKYRSVLRDEFETFNTMNVLFINFRLLHLYTIVLNGSFHEFMHV